MTPQDGGHDAHGIEDAAERERAGKDPSGLIAIELHHEGNDVSVSFRDDGAGLNQERIAARARSLGLLAPDQVLSQDEASELIFQPGFSTAEQVSELAGRGIGMDVVRSEVNALGGRIESGSEDGRGTHFDLILPLTTAVTQVVMVRIGALSGDVRKLRRLQAAAAADQRKALAIVQVRREYS